MLTKKEIVVAVLSFNLGIILMGFVVKTELISNRQQIKNCRVSLGLLNQLTNNCFNAYKEFGSCVVDLDTCNLQKSTLKLNSLNEDKIKLETELTKIILRLKQE